jgi:hypothetical protein
MALLFAAPPSLVAWCIVARQIFSSWCPTPHLNDNHLHPETHCRILVQAKILFRGVEGSLVARGQRWEFGGGGGRRLMRGRLAVKPLHGPEMPKIKKTIRDVCI